MARSYRKRQDAHGHHGSVRIMLGATLAFPKGGALTCPTYPYCRYSLPVGRVAKRYGRRRFDEITLWLVMYLEGL